MEMEFKTSRELLIGIALGLCLSLIFVPTGSIKAVTSDRNTITNSSAAVNTTLLAPDEETSMAPLSHAAAAQANDRIT
jgi:hypothetical protein